MSSTGVLLVRDRLARYGAPRCWERKPEEVTLEWATVAGERRILQLMETPFVYSRDPGPRLTHYLFRYPAKFHPPVARALIERYSDPGATILDPFCGSGTLLVESMTLGRHSIGIDVDPVAAFVAEAKTRLYDNAVVTAAVDSVLVA